MDRKRITRAQLDLWLELPTTRTYLECLFWEWEKRVEEGGEAQGDPDNADRSHATIFENKGFRDGLQRAQDVENVLNRSGMLEEEDDNAGTA